MYVVIYSKCFRSSLHVCCQSFAIVLSSLLSLWRLSAWRKTICDKRHQKSFFCMFCLVRQVFRIVCLKSCLHVLPVLSVLLYVFVILVSISMKVLTKRKQHGSSTVALTWCRLILAHSLAVLRGTREGRRVPVQFWISSGFFVLRFVFVSVKLNLKSAGRFSASFFNKTINAKSMDSILTRPVGLEV
jgi:hypothetical protein